MLKRYNLELDREALTGAVGESGIRGLDVFALCDSPLAPVANFQGFPIPDP